MNVQHGGATVKLIALLLIALFLAVVYLARHPLLRLVAEEWVVEDHLQKSDAIIVLSDDNFYADRATRAAELYRQGMAPLVVASGRQLRPYAGIAELMKHDLFERGVPTDAILPFPQNADDTEEEAEALAGLSIQKKWHSVIVVTSNYHTRRARYIFLHVFPGSISVAVASARDGDFDPEHWYEKRKSIKRLILEFCGMAESMWELRGRGASRGGAQLIVVWQAEYLQSVV
jgi:uncharacterized SAM-binding protein YcdF (DUF218 family)